MPNKSFTLSDSEVDFILSPEAIRDRAAKIFEFTKAGKGKFVFHPEKFEPTVNYVLDVIRQNYPGLDIPFHSRWGHFRAGKIDRVKDLDAKLADLDVMERARTKLDLVITSVLLDAGAGAAWSYQEGKNSFNRSEGLGVASYHMFLAGEFSCDGKSLKADASGLSRVSGTALEKAFQVTEKNPLLGVRGRLQLLNNLAQAVGNKTIFKDGRPGNIVDYLVGKHGNSIPAKAILRAVLDGLGPIWPGRITAGMANLGDVWTHPQLGPEGSFATLVPFHKLSQWMTYSLIEPIVEAGINVTGVEGLTGLAEYRNGGLLLDGGLLTLQEPSMALQAWHPETELVVEWRALTVALLDQIGAAVQKSLGKTPQEFPLAKVLEGGTWWAGRYLAQDKRKSGNPPIMIESDGTVF